MLGLHGWLDNAATYDHLAPLLAPGEETCLVSVDLPGHGLSSRHPPGLLYRMSDNFVMVRAVLEHLGWGRAVLLGHSMGGGLATWYAAMFPEQVERLVVLDLLCFSPLALPKHVPAARHAVLQTLDTVRRMERPVQPRYSRQEAVTRALAASNSLANQHLAPAEHTEQITRSSVETLLRRGLVPLEDTEAAGGCSYTWSADYRLRVPSGLNMTEDMAAEFASQVQCPHLVVKAAQGPRYMSAEVYTRLREVFRKYNQNFVYRELAGGHHLHLNTPEAVAPVINKFLAQKFDTSANLDEEHKPQFDL